MHYLPLLIVVLLLLLTLTASAAPEASRDNFGAALKTFLDANQTVKDDKGTALGQPAVVSTQVREYENSAMPIRGMAVVTYQPGDRKFELFLQYPADRWIFAAAFAIEAGPTRDVVRPVGWFTCPPALQPVILPGEEGKPVVTTKSGLQYVVLDEGQGKQPTKGQTIVAEYSGWLTDGTKFDSSKDHPGEFSFPVGQGRVIPGWDEALLDMKVGERRKLILPPGLAYGDRGAGDVIPPNSTLIFEVKLVKIK